MKGSSRIIILFCLTLGFMSTPNLGSVGRLINAQNKLIKKGTMNRSPRKASTIGDYTNALDKARAQLYVKKMQNLRPNAQDEQYDLPDTTPLISPTNGDDSAIQQNEVLQSGNLEGSNAPIYVQKLHDQLSPLENDYDQILDNFRSIGCFESDASKQNIQSLIADPVNGIASGSKPNANPYSTCEGEIADSLLKPLNEVNSKDNSLFQHLNNNVYRPLSYSVGKNRYSFLDALEELLNLDPDNMAIKKDLPIPNFNQFKSMMVGGFSQIAQYSAKFDANKDLISKIIMDMLKNFHIYWNVKRQRNQIDSTKINTYSILKEIITRYRQINANMKAVSVYFLTLVRDAYMTFIKAHKMFGILTGSPNDLFSYQILKRYTSNVQMLQSGEFWPNNIFFEMSILMDMYRGITLTYAGSGQSDQEVRNYFQTNVIDKIMVIYNVYAKSMIESNDPTFDKVTDFTATLILKFKHREGRLVWTTSAKGYSPNQSFVFDNGLTTHVKLYYEMIDLLMLIPSLCVDSTRLSSCIFGIGGQAISKLRTKYNLWYSTNGHSLVRHFEGLIWQIHMAVSANAGYTNFNFFKNLFFAELFKVAEQFKTNYCINDMWFVIRLQDELGELIQKEKSAEGIPVEIAGMLDDFDDKMYDFFLDIKNDFNDYVHVDKNPSQLKQIQDRLSQFVDKYVEEHDLAKDSRISGCWELMKIYAKQWVDPYLRKYTDRIGTTSAETPSSIYVPLPKPKSFDIINIINEPQIDTGARAPIYIPKEVPPQ